MYDVKFFHLFSYCSSSKNWRKLSGKKRTTNDTKKKKLKMRNWLFRFEAVNVFFCMKMTTTDVDDDIGDDETEKEEEKR